MVHYTYYYLNNIENNRFKLFFFKPNVSRKRDALINTTTNHIHNDYLLMT